MLHFSAYFTIIQVRFYIHKLLVSYKFHTNLIQLRSINNNKILAKKITILEYIKNIEKPITILSVPSTRINEKQ